jgi:threonine dehydratase
MDSKTDVDLSIHLEDVLAARERLRGAIYYSPCPHSQMLSALTGQQVYLKLENLQMTGSFKERGALNRIATLTPEQAARGVIAASAGNHAQGVAYHATKRGIRALIVMPLTTPLVKVTATRDFGAEVLLHGASYDEAYAEALRQCAAQDLTFIHPFDDPHVMAGQGTIGLELMEQVPQLEAVVVPIGGGGLIGGIACAIKETRPGIRIVGVQALRLPSMVAAVEAHQPVTIDPATTIADGIAVRRAGDLTLPLVERYVDEIVTGGRGRDCVGDPDAAGAREDAGGRRGRGGAGGPAAAPDQPDGCAHGGAGVRRQYRRHAARADYRARPGAGRPADSPAHSSAGQARRAARADPADCEPPRQHR